MSPRVVGRPQDDTQIRAPPSRRRPPRSPADGSPMERRLRREEVMTIEVLAERSTGARGSPSQRGRSPRRLRCGCGSARPTAAGAISRRSTARSWPSTAFTTSLRSLQRFVARHYPPPKLRARRRIETPPGAQGQVDWSTWPRVPLRQGPEELFALHLVLSWSCQEAVVWSPLLEPRC